MSVEVRPLGVHCNIECLYCYQHPGRDASTAPQQYDLVKIKKAIELEGQPFHLFGGEPLLLPLAHLEDLWSWGYQRFGRNSIQTNGTLISDDHIRLFRKYNVSVGMSMDGPDELNDARWHGNLQRTRQSTERSQAAIERLCAEGILPGLIITLHRVNAAQDRLATLIQWVRHLYRLGVRGFRLHLLESESDVVRAKLSLTPEENIRALRTFMDLERELCLEFDMFKDMRNLLTGDDRSTACVWGACDPYTTKAVRGIEGNGQRSNCGRTNKDGIEFVKANQAGFERYLALYNTPQEFGGCMDCRFFLMCKGHCPGTAIAGDWRNRTEHCEVWKSMLTLFESELEGAGKEPLSLSPRRTELESAAIDLWTNQQSVSLFRLVNGSPTEKSSGSS